MSDLPWTDLALSYFCAFSFFLLVVTPKRKEIILGAKLLKGYTARTDTWRVPQVEWAPDDPEALVISRLKQATAGGHLTEERVILSIRPRHPPSAESRPTSPESKPNSPTAADVITSPQADTGVVVASDVVAGEARAEANGQLRGGAEAERQLSGGVEAERKHSGGAEADRQLSGGAEEAAVEANRHHSGREGLSDGAHGAHERGAHRGGYREGGEGPTDRSADTVMDEVAAGVRVTLKVKPLPPELRHVEFSRHNASGEARAGKVSEPVCHIS
jgi:hypothetical protein